MDTDSQQPTSVNEKPVVAKEIRNDDSEVFHMIKRVTAWVMILSATLFALVGVLAVWEVFGPNAGDVVWRAFISLVIIAFAALVVNVASRVATGKR